MNAQLFRLLLALFLLQSSVFAKDSPVVTEWLAAQANLKSLTSDFRQERVLREGRRPIVSEGKFAYSVPGSFRWQMGEPAVTLAVQKAKGDLVIANVKRKTATIYPFAVVKEEEAAMGFSFIEAGFPKSKQEFDKNFTITDEELKNGVHHVTVKLNNRRASLGLRKMIFMIDEQSFKLRGFYLRFRDSSSITTTFSNVRENPGVQNSAFSVDLSGYETKTEKVK